MAGLPAVAVPAGFSEEGLPLGVQLIAGRGQEDLLLATAAMLEGADERFRVRVAPISPPRPEGSER